jgi:hypothetical protein
MPTRVLVAKVDKAVRAVAKKAAVAVGVAGDAVAVDEAAVARVARAGLRVRPVQTNRRVITSKKPKRRRHPRVLPSPHRR